MQAPKNGFFYVIDRTSGEFISAEPYVYTNWASGIDAKTGRPIENDRARYKQGDVEIFPSVFGGHNWQPMAYNPHTQLVYIPVQENSLIFSIDPDWKFVEAPGKENLGIIWGGKGPKDQVLRDSLAPDSNPVGRLIAWDPVNQKAVWRVNYDDVWWNGGVLTTGGGLVFQGGGNGYFKAYDAENGEKLWEADLGTGIMAAPITFEVDGIQYISVAVGWGGPLGKSMQFTEYNYPGTVYTFALGESTPFPDYPKPPPNKFAVFDFETNPETLAHGKTLYNNHCFHCHNQIARETGGAIPDLGYMNKSKYESFEAVVLEGLFSQNGMPNFKKQLTTNDVLDIKNYIIATANSKNDERTNGNKD
jgi:quinohemoprotein ethanol dehydrogenase